MLRLLKSTSRTNRTKPTEYQLWFQASAGGLRTHPWGQTEECCTCLCKNIKLYIMFVCTSGCIKLHPGLFTEGGGLAHFPLPGSTAIDLKKRKKADSFSTDLSLCVSEICQHSCPKEQGLLYNCILQSSC